MIPDPQIDCNTFCMISGTSKNVPKSGPSDPVFITEIFEKHKKIWERLWTTLLSYLRIWNPENVGRCAYMFLKLWTLKIWNSDNFKMEIWNAEIGNLTNLEMRNLKYEMNFRNSKLEFEKWESRRLAPENDKDPR